MRSAQIFLVHYTPTMPFCSKTGFLLNLGSLFSVLIRLILVAFPIEIEINVQQFWSWQQKCIHDEHSCHSIQPCLKRKTWDALGTGQCSTDFGFAAPFWFLRGQSLGRAVYSCDPNSTGTRLHQSFSGHVQKGRVVIDSVCSVCVFCFHNR